MQCPRCQRENPTDAKFCLECGHRFAIHCHSCGTELPSGSKFCKECGQPLAAPARAPSARFPSPESYTPRHLAEKILISKSALEGERKQVTVLFADLKGSMELLADRDPEEARKILDPILELMMEAVHRFEGTVNQVMGDGIMALFGAPIAHEDHAVRACYAALRMQQSVKLYAEGARRKHGITIRIRVGLNSGEVVVRAIGSDLHMDYTAVGQTTHLAARMEQLADPGSTFLTSETIAFAEGFVQVTALGPMAIKGLLAPVEVYELLGSSAVRSRLGASVTRGLSCFVGRDAEIEHLRRALERASQGRGQVATIVGEPGVGKSRLVFELTHSYRVEGWLVLVAGSVSYGKATSYLPVIELLKSYFRVGERDTYRNIREKVTGKVLTLDRVLEPALPALLALFDVPIEDSQWSALDPTQRRQRTLDAVKRLLLREAQVQPLLVVFEDLHWIDSETQALLESLVESLPTMRLLLLLNYRPEYRHGWSSKTYYTQLRLDALPPASTGELLNALLGLDASLHRLKAALAEQTGGNPLFLEESVRTLVEMKALTGERGAYHLAQPVEALRVPATVQSILASRIDRLPPKVKRLLQTAAVIGKDFPFALLEAIADESDQMLRRGLDHLQAAEFVYETSLFPDLEYTFKHVLTHQVAYQGMLQDERRDRHARIVEALKTRYLDRLTERLDILAYHAFRGELWDEAVSFSRRAGARAFSRAANMEAATFFRQALAVLTHVESSREIVEQGFDIRLELRHALFALGEQDTIYELLREAEALATALSDHGRLALVLTFLANYFWYGGRNDDAVDTARRALSIATEVGDFGSRVAALFRYGQANHAAGQYRRGLDSLRTARELLSPDRIYERFGGSMPTAVEVGVWSAWSYAQLGEFAEAIACGTEAVRISETVSDDWALSHACFGLGYAYLMQGNFLEAIGVLERGVRRCEGSGFTVFWLVNAAELGYAYCLAGRFLEGLALLKEVLARADSLKALFSQSLWVAWLGEAHLLAGSAAEAAELACRALETSRLRKEQGSEAWVLRLLGSIAASHDSPDLEAADADYRQALSLASELGMRPILAHCHLGLGKLYRRTGKREQAQEHFITATMMYREMDMPFWLEQAEVEMALAKPTS